MEDKAYADLMISLTERIFKKNYNYMLDAKDDMIGDAFLNLWKAKNKYNSDKAKINTYMSKIINNSFKKYIRDNVYRHQDKFIDLNLLSDEDGNTMELEDFIGTVDVNYENIETRELMKKFDKCVINKNKRTSRKININELHKIIELLDKGYTQVEIAKMMDVSQNTTKKKIHRIRNVITEINKNNE